MPVRAVRAPDGEPAAPQQPLAPKRAMPARVLQEPAVARTARVRAWIATRMTTRMTSMTTTTWTTSTMMPRTTMMSNTTTTLTAPGADVPVVPLRPAAGERLPKTAAT